MDTRSDIEDATVDLIVGRESPALMDMAQQIADQGL